MITQIEKFVLLVYNRNKQKKITPDFIHQLTKGQYRPYIRQLVIFVFLKYYQKQYNKAADFFGLDRTTAIAAEKKIQSLYQVDKNVVSDVDEIIKLCDEYFNHPNNIEINENDYSEAVAFLWKSFAIKQFQKNIKYKSEISQFMTNVMFL